MTRDQALDIAVAYLSKAGRTTSQEKYARYLQLADMYMRLAEMMMRR